MAHTGERGAGCITKVKYTDKKTGERKESRFWYILYYQDGRQIRESSGSEVKQRAKELLRQRLGERALGFQPHQDLKKVRYEDIRQSLLDDYAANRLHSLQRLADGKETVWGLPHLDSFFRGRAVSKITTDTLRAFVRKRQTEGAEPGTINRNLALLRRMLFLAKREGKIREVPYFPMLKENAPRKGFLENEQFEKLHAALPVKLRPLVTFLYFTGCRLGEARKIQWAQIDLTNRQVRLEGSQTKNGEPRVLPLPDQLVDMLRRQEPKSGAVFYSGQFRKSWITACVKAGLGHWELSRGAKKSWDGLLVHDLRRSAVRNLIRVGVNERVAMEISGHKTRSVFDRYNIVSTDDLHRAMNRVEAARRVIDVPVKQLPEGENNTSLMKAGPIEESSQRVR